MSNTKATWSFSLDCYCPKCNYYFDVTDDNSYDLFGMGLSVCEQDTVISKDIEVNCPNCSHEFLVDYQY